MEATIAQPSQSSRASDRRLAQLQDEINRVNCPDFWLWLDISGTATENIPVGHVRKRLENWLATFNADQIAATAQQTDAALPNFSASYGGITFTITARPKSPDQRGRPGARPLGAIMPDVLFECDAYEDIKQAVVKKAKSYGDLSLPYVVAINVISEFLDFDDVLDGLFGRGEITAWQQPRGTWHHEVRHVPNGAWTSRKGPSNSIVSGVLIADRLIPTTVGVETPLLIHNPWAQRSLPTDVWPLPQRSVEMPTGTIVSHAGLQARVVLELPEPWPVRD